MPSGFLRPFYTSLEGGAKKQEQRTKEEQLKNFGTRSRMWLGGGGSRIQQLWNCGESGSCQEVENVEVEEETNRKYYCRASLPSWARDKKGARERNRARKRKTEGFMSSFRNLSLSHTHLFCDLLYYDFFFFLTLWHVCVGAKSAVSIFNYVNKPTNALIEESVSRLTRFCQEKL